MISITVFFAAGAALGLSLTAFVLIVPILTALAVAGGTFLYGYSFGFAVIVFLAAAISCQAGYLASSLTRTLISPARAASGADNIGPIGSRALRRRHVFGLRRSSRMKAGTQERQPINRRLELP
jgi:hypothetical protein